MVIAVVLADRRGSTHFGESGHQQMSVVAQDDEAVDLDSVLALRATDDADDQVIGAQAGAQQEPAVKRSQSDLYERAWRKKAQMAGHARTGVETPPILAGFPSEVGGP